MGGGSFNPLSVMLKENKLTGPNYINWKRNLNLVLTAQEYKFVLTDVCLPPPSRDSSKEDVEAYQLWRKVLGKKTVSHALLSLCMAQSFDTLIKYHFPP